MVIYDPLYGRFQIPAHLAGLVVTPEVRRLAQIRLVNTPSPSLPALGDVRRFSHTLGVLRLSQESRSAAYSEHEWRAFEASVLLHDVGTPAFAHLVEYHLRDAQKGWHHEQIIRDILRGFHAPENRAHQIFAGRTIEFKRILDFYGIPLDLVEAIITKRHALSLLLFGTIDLDNLDNVARMASALGISGGSEVALTLAAALRVRSLNSPTLTLAEGSGKRWVEKWAYLRRRVYEIMNFDATAVSAQAVLSEAIYALVQAGDLSADEWYVTDEQLIDKLLHHPATKASMSREYFGRLPTPAICLQVQGTLGDIGLKDRAECKALIEKALSAAFPEQKVLGYTIIDKGTFEKRLEFFDPISGTNWEYGQTSLSVILYGFIRSLRSPPQRDSLARAYHILMGHLGVTPNRCKQHWWPYPEMTKNDQSSFDFATQ